MMMFRLAAVLAAVFAFALLTNGDTAPSCLAYRSLTTPAPMPNLTNCPQYRDMACCSYDYDDVILPKQNRTQLYGFNWDRCGPMSPACSKFFQAESCYWECDPYQAPWADKTAKNPSGIVGVPVCSGYCNAWFEACKNDYTCGTEWLIDFVPMKDSQGNPISYGCRPDATCKTFAQVYDNAQGLCDMLWGGAFHYSEDLGNCVEWDFGLTTGNLNRKVKKTDYQESFCNTTVLALPDEPRPSSPIAPQCLGGRELTVPSAQPGLKNCARYKDMSCCSTGVDSQVTNTAGGAILGYNWNACGTLSPKCEQFFIDHACFYECDPYQAPWRNPIFNNSASFYGYPICEDYCGQWFDACKDDKVCGHEWILSYQPVQENGNVVGYTCNADTQCKTFAEVYDNSRGLCDVLYGSWYHYSEDKQNCARWDFSGRNPHQDMWKTPYAEGYCRPKIDMTKVAAITLGVLFAVTFVGCGAFVIFLIVREKKERPVFSAQMKQLN